MVKTGRKPDLEVKSEDVTELLQSHDNTGIDEKLLPMNKQRKWFLNCSFLVKSL